MSPLVLLLSLAAALGPDQRVAVVIGNDAGSRAERPLEFAESDAELFHALMLGAGGVERDRAYLVQGGDLAAVRRAIAEAKGQLRELSRAGPTALIVYVSGHADEEAIHLGEERLPIAELRRELADSRATLRLLVIDACRTAVVARAKGGRPGPEVAVAMDRRASVAGDVLITSAGAGEPAQEWPYLHGSLFTHHLLAGLRGLADVDADGRVSLAEAYAYAFRRTAAGAAESGVGAQHPAFDMSMTGWGEWAFTRPTALGATIVFGPDLAGSFLVADQRRGLVAELDKREGEVVRVGVLPGWYRVVRPSGRLVDVVDLNLGFGGERAVSAAELVRVPAERARLRGAEPIELRPNGVALGYRISSGLVRGLSVQQAAGVELERTSGDWLARTSVYGSTASFAAPAQQVTHRQLELALGGARLVWLSFARLSLGLEVGAIYAQQIVERDAQDEITRVFGRGPVRHDALVPFGGVRLSAELPLTESWWARAELASVVAGVPLGEEGTTARVLLRGGLSIAWWP